MSPSRDRLERTQKAALGLLADGRVLAIDRYRGLLVVLMVVADYLSGVVSVPAYLKHAQDVGLTIIDVGAPCFVFAMGLTYGASFRRRSEAGLGPAYRHFVVRYLALIGIGAILAAGSTQVAGLPAGWGVLQALGVAGLICLPFIRLGTAWRFAIGAAMLVGYQVLIDALGPAFVRSEVQGGLTAGLSWGALLILSTAVADIWRRGMPALMWCCGALALAAVLSVLIVPVSKTRVSLSYILVCLTLGAVGFAIVDLLSRVLPRRAGYFAWWGENALLLYIVHLVLLGLISLPRARWWYVDPAPWLLGAQLLALLTLMSWLAWWLHRTGRRVRL